MTSKFDCFGPGFLKWVYPPKKPTRFFGYVPGCPNPANNWWLDAAVGRTLNLQFIGHGLESCMYTVAQWP